MGICNILLWYLVIRVLIIFLIISSWSIRYLQLFATLSGYQLFSWLVCDITQFSHTKHFIPMGVVFFLVWPMGVARNTKNHILHRTHTQNPYHHRDFKRSWGSSWGEVWGTISCCLAIWYSYSSINSGNSSLEGNSKGECHVHLHRQAWS